MCPMPGCCSAGIYCSSAARRSCGPDGIRSVRGYFLHITEQIDAAHRKGLSWAEAADTIDLGEYAGWLDAERVVVNVYQRYRELDPDTPQLEILALLVMQAEWLARRSA